MVVVVIERPVRGSGVFSVTGCVGTLGTSRTEHRFPDRASANEFLLRETGGGVYGWVKDEFMR